MGSGRGGILHIHFQVLVNKLIIEIQISRNTNWVLVYLILPEGLNEVWDNIAKICRYVGNCYILE